MGLCVGEEEVLETVGTDSIVGTAPVGASDGCAVGVIAVGDPVL